MYACTYIYPILKLFTHVVIGANYVPMHSTLLPKPPL